MNDIVQHMRPTAITVICVIGFIVVLLVIPAIFSPFARAIGPWYPVTLGVSGFLSFRQYGRALEDEKMGCVSLYREDRGCPAYHGGDGALGGVAGLLFPAIVIFFGLKYLPKMS